MVKKNNLRMHVNILASTGQGCLHVIRILGYREFWGKQFTRIQSHKGWDTELQTLSSNISQQLCKLRGLCLHPALMTNSVK